ncbi:hypothetical protein HHI36_019438 [Cryptolaemus montrouzieri]|uniref:Uncharacterized protein n=1 Tax=Cryptolaemus montrouzieri TaxID=559131 RepID=A0ABD2P358_9CUCU
MFNGFSKELSDDTSSIKPNKDKAGTNVKANTFLSRISKDEPVNLLKQSTSAYFPTFTSADISEELGRLKLTQVHSLPTFKKSTENNFDIDLTTALRKNSSETSKFKNTSSEDKFEIPFIACDLESDINNLENSSMKCTLDTRHLATQKVGYENKRPTQLGKLLCLRYAIPKHKIKRKKFKLNTKLVRFDFSSPSPDDQIRKYLQRDF